MTEEYPDGGRGEGTFDRRPRLVRTDEATAASEQTDVERPQHS